MRATSSAEFLKAHAVISRSWLLAQIDKAKTVRGTYSSCRVDQEEYIRWYETISTSTYVPTIIVNAIKGSVKPIPLLSGKRWKLPGEKYLPTKEPFVTPAFQNAAEASWKNFPLAGKT